VLVSRQSRTSSPAPDYSSASAEQPTVFEAAVKTICTLIQAFLNIAGVSGSSRSTLTNVSAAGLRGRRLTVVA
jgi:hypothetical protein